MVNADDIKKILCKVDVRHMSQLVFSSYWYIDVLKYVNDQQSVLLG